MGQISLQFCHLSTVFLQETVRKCRPKEVIDANERKYESNELNQYTQRETPWWLPVSGVANRPGGATIAVNGTPLSDNAWTNRYFYKAQPKESPANAILQTIALLGTSGAGVDEPHTLHALARPVTETFTYDDDGNLTADSLWHYAYDGENRLKWIRCLIPDENGNKLSVEFTYDYMGRRAAKDIYHYTGVPAWPDTRVFVSRTLFLYQGWTLLCEYSATGDPPVGSGGTGDSPVLQRRYIWGPDLSGTMGGAGDIGGLLTIEDLRPAHAGTYHPAYDGNGNLMALTEASTGNMVAAHEYDPFGNQLRKTYSANATGHYPQGGAPGTVPKKPSMSVGNPAKGNQNINLYIYVGNNPIFEIVYKSEAVKNASKDNEDDKKHIVNGKTPKEHEYRHTKISANIWNDFADTVNGHEKEWPAKLLAQCAGALVIASYNLAMAKDNVENLKFDYREYGSSSKTDLDARTKIKMRLDLAERNLQRAQGDHEKMKAQYDKYKKQYDEYMERRSNR